MMVLPDTSVWVDHLRQGDPLLFELLCAGNAAVHPFVIGELACGNLKNRDQILALLAALPHVPMATDEEALALLSDHSLYGKGLGWIDVHLLASALIGGVPLWTKDIGLARAAQSLGAAA